MLNVIFPTAIEKLTKNNPIHNLNLAFKTAEEKLGICKLLDPEDVYTEKEFPMVRQAHVALSILG